MATALQNGCEGETQLHVLVMPGGHAQHRAGIQQAVTAATHCKPNALTPVCPLESRAAPGP